MTLESEWMNFELDSFLLDSSQLSLRHTVAQILGYENHAEYATALRMAKSPEKVSQDRKFASLLLLLSSLLLSLYYLLWFYTCIELHYYELLGRSHSAWSLLYTHTALLNLRILRMSIEVGRCSSGYLPLFCLYLHWPFLVQVKDFLESVSTRMSGVARKELKRLRAMKVGDYASSQTQCC